jgi:hypothetical protein
MVWGIIHLCTLAWPCKGIHHGLDNRGGSGTREDGGGRSDVAVTARHMVTKFWPVTHVEFSYNSANFEPKIMVSKELKSSQTGVYLHII